MRIEYELYQRLTWDPAFRRAVAGADSSEIERLAPNSVHLEAIVKLAKSPGLEEECYRRIASLFKISAEIFSYSHQLFVSYFGDEFFERVLASYFDDCGDLKGTVEILEPFDGYVAGPRLLRAAKQAAKLAQMSWLADLAGYDWAVWHAARVAEGWPALENVPPLVPGATLLSVTYDLPSLLREIKRLQRSGVSPEIYRQRIQPAPGQYYAVILPKDGQVMQAKIDRELYEDISKNRSSDSNILDPDYRCFIEELGIVVANSFLCCSPEFRRSANSLADVIAPEPH